MLLALGWVAMSAAPAGAQEDLASIVPAVAEARELMAAARAAPAQREALLDQADTVLSAAARDLPAESMDRLGTELERVDVALARAQAPADRLAWLLGSARDRRVLGELAGRLVQQGADLDARIATALEHARQDLRLLVTEAPALEQLQQQVRYKLAWGHFYVGLAGEEPPGKGPCGLSAEHLQMAVGNVAAFYEVPAVGGWANLLAGMCRRRLGDADQAQRLLDVAASAGPAPAAAQAQFERLLLQIQQAPDPAAMETVYKQFDALSAALDAAGFGPAQTALRSAVLKEQWYGRLAELAPDEPTRHRRRVEAQRALLEVLERSAGLSDDEPVLTVLAWREQNDAVGDDPASSLNLLWQAARQDEPAAAGAALGAVLESTDELNLSTHPLALWRLGGIQASAGLLRESARTYERLARGFPTSGLAPRAWEQSARQTQRLILLHQRQHRPVPVDLRQEFAATIEGLLAAGSGDGSAWAYDLGLQYEQLLSSAGATDAQALRDQAIAAYERVNVGPIQAHPAPLRALELRAQQLLAGDAPDGPAARELIGRLRHQVDVASAAAGGEGADVQACREHAARAMFWSARLTHHGGAAREAADLLGGIQRDYPRTQGARLAGEFQVHLLLEGGQTLEAAQVVKRLIEDDPRASGQLVALVLGRMRQRLDDRWLGLAKDPPASSDYCRDYLTLARALHEPLKDAPLAQRYGQAQMLADALLESSQPREAMELFDQCERYDRQGQAQSAPADGPAAVDARNLLGLARANRAMGRYEEALGYYRMLTDGMDPAAAGVAYWRAELEYARCVLEAAPADAVAMGRLEVRLRQLRLLDAAMGGLAEPFTRIAQQARSLSGQPPN